MAATMRFRGRMQFDGAVEAWRSQVESRDFSQAAFEPGRLRWNDEGGAAVMEIDVTASGPAAGFDRAVALLAEIGSEASVGEVDCVLLADEVRATSLVLPDGDREPIEPAALRRRHGDLFGLPASAFPRHRDDEVVAALLAASCPVARAKDPCAAALRFVVEAVGDAVRARERVWCATPVADILAREGRLEGEAVAWLGLPGAADALRAAGQRRRGFFSRTEPLHAELSAQVRSWEKRAAAALARAPSPRSSPWIAAIVSSALGRRVWPAGGDTLDPDVASTLEAWIGTEIGATWDSGFLTPPVPATRAALALLPRATGVLAVRLACVARATGFPGLALRSSADFPDLFAKPVVLAVAERLAPSARAGAELIWDGYSQMASAADALRHKRAGTEALDAASRRWFAAVSPHPIAFRPEDGGA